MVISMEFSFVFVSCDRASSLVATTNGDIYHIFYVAYLRVISNSCLYWNIVAMMSLMIDYYLMVPLIFHYSLYKTF